MNTRDCVNKFYEDLEHGIEPVREHLFRLVEEDTGFSLSTDEATELIDDMIVEYIRHNTDLAGGGK